MPVVTLLSDFVDGTSMALSENTEAPSLNSYMVRNPGQLWAGMQQRRLTRNLTRRRRGPGTLYYAPTETAQACVNAYLQTETGSERRTGAAAGHEGQWRRNRPPYWRSD